MVHKELSSFESFYEAYAKVEERNLPMVIHFRLATHGSRDLDNCHPFLVTPKLGFVHNGIISKMPYHVSKSDTNLFRDALVESNVTDIPTGALKELIQSFIGTYNKLIFLNNKGNYCIINESEGVWDNDVWYSNCGYKPYNYGYSKVDYSKKDEWADNFDYDYDYGGMVPYWRKQQGRKALPPQAGESVNISRIAAEKLLDINRTITSASHFTDEEKTGICDGCGKFRVEVSRIRLLIANTFYENHWVCENCSEELIINKKMIM